MMFCGKCGAQIADGSKFCPKCGNRVVAASAAANAPQGQRQQPRQAGAQQPGRPAQWPQQPGQYAQAQGAPQQAWQSQQPQQPQQQAPGQPSAAPGGPRIPGGLSKKKLVALGATAAAVVVLVVLLVTQLTAKTTITVTDSIEISYSGCNGYATASISGNYAWREEALAELSDKADNNVELLNWQEALYSVSVTYDISPNENLSNGDTVTVTATITGDEALEDLPINLETKELEFTVADLEDVQVIDLFANVELTYEGYGPTAVPYVSDSCDYADVTVTYSCDKEYVDNGDTVVVTASYDAKALLAAGYQAEADTKEYTVSGLTSYISAIANIPDDDLAKMKSQAEDILAANVASNWSEDNEEFKSTEFLGCYLLTPKSTTSGYTGNYLYLVYKVKAWNASDGNLTYYTAFTYENVLTLADGTLSYDLDACSMSGNKYYPSGSWLGYYYYGYGSLESLFSAYVTANIDYWAYESTVSED